MYTGLKAAFALFAALVVLTNVTRAQRAILVSDSAVEHGSTGCIDVFLNGDGNEFATAFSLAFDTNLLTFTGASRAVDGPAASFFVNTNYAAGGLLGILVAQTTAGSGTLSHLVRVCFRARAGIPDATTPVWLCDTPIARDTIDRVGTHLPANYRDGTVTIAGICGYTLSAATNRMASAGGPASVSVQTTAPCAWEVVNTNSWISGPTGGLGSATLTFTVAPNPVPVPRTGTVSIGGRAFAINQDRGPCTFELSPTSRIHDQKSVNTTFDVITHETCDWVVENTNAWILIKLYTNGTGSGLVRYTVLANPDPHARSGAIVVGGQPFTVMQTGADCSYSLAPTNRIVSAAGASSQVSIFAPTDCPWTVVNTNIWISLNGSNSGSGGTILNYTVAPRFGVQERTGVLTVEGQRFTVTQLGSPCAYTVTPLSRTHTRLAATNTISVTPISEFCATLPWTATTTNDWIRILIGANGISTGTVRYAVSQYDFGGTRSGAILAADQVVTVTQTGFACSYSRTPSSRSHSYLAETGSVAVSTLPGCPWTARASQPWVTITSGASGNGNGTISYVLQTNIGPSRSATLTIGSLTFAITQGAASPPTISAAPASQGVLPGGSVTFSVMASGSAPLTYQWRFNGLNLADGPNVIGATTSRLTLLNVQPAHVGDYAVVVSNIRGSVTSSPPAALRVNTSPVFQPMPLRSVNRGSLLAFRPVAFDNDLPAQSLNFSFISAPSGAIIDPVSGLVTWTPSASHPLGTNSALIRVLDSGSPALSATQRVDIAVISVPTTNVTLIATGSVWKYRDTGQDLGSAWSASSFDDSAWQSGPAALGYGLSDLRTTVAHGPSTSSRHITTYFRRTFTLPNAAALSALNIRVRRDDGVVLYLNGREIYRNNMSAGSIGYLTLASTSASSSSEFLTGPADASALRDGINVLAAELHQQSAGSSDIVFDLGINAVMNLVTPVIFTQPLSQTVPEGTTVELSVTANGLAPLHYQWWFNNSPIAGATGSTLVLPMAQPAASGEYYVMVTNSAGAVASAVAHLTVFKVINIAPVLSPISDKTIAEGLPLSFTATATDANGAPQRLTFTLDAAPPGAAIHPEQGTFVWTPGELDGGSAFPVTIRVIDNGSPPLSDSASFSIMVLDTNNAPVLFPIGSKTVLENTLLTFTATAVDPDIPSQNLTFSLGAGAPAGAAIDPATGLFSWAPTEVQAPSTNFIVVRVMDDGVPPLMDFETITIVAIGLNTPPVLQPIANRAITAGERVTFTVVASDTDLPPQAIAFSLEAGAPVGAGIHPATGAFTWQSSASDAGSTNRITVRATDNGSPPSSSTQAFTIWVLPGAQTNLMLIASNSVWKYRDTGQNLGTAWREQGYSDTAWASGPGTLGYGGSYITTEVGYGPSSSSRYITTYFRRTFAVGNPAALSPLRLRVRRDDGVVVYINGTEVHRDNMPSGVIAFDTLAPLNMDAEDELTYFAAGPIPTSVLAAGENTIAVEVHQKSVGSSDLSFDLELAATVSVLPPAIVAHPESQAIIAGQNARFDVTAFGTPPFRYQWRFNGAIIPNATNATLTLLSPLASAAGDYHVTVTNLIGVATSQPATLTILPADSEDSTMDQSGPELRIERTGDAVRLFWNTVPSRRYRIEYGESGDLTGLWITLGEILAVSDAASAVDSAPLVQQRFYRILVLP